MNEVLALALSSKHRPFVSFTFNTNEEDFDLSRASKTLQALSNPSNCPNISSVAITTHHLPTANSPIPT
jgi:hypothetical protein